MSVETERAAFAEKYRPVAKERQRRKRAGELWAKLRRQGYESLDELLSDPEQVRREAQELKARLPGLRLRHSETYQGMKLEAGLTAEDLLPSPRVIETLVRDLPKVAKKKVC